MCSAAVSWQDTCGPKTVRGSKGFSCSERQGICSSRSPGGKAHGKAGILMWYYRPGTNVADTCKASHSAQYLHTPTLVPISSSELSMKPHHLPAATVQTQQLSFPITAPPWAGSCQPRLTEMRVLRNGLLRARDKQMMQSGWPGFGIQSRIHTAALAQVAHAGQEATRFP